MKTRRLALACVLVGGLSVAGTATLVPTRQACAQQRAKISYHEDIVPIFRGWCLSCHTPPEGQGFKASGVDLSTYTGLMKGTKFGKVVLPKDPDGSTLYALISGRTSPEIRMPFGHKPLPDCLRLNIWTWIFEGAQDN
jgi:hypothetical protein